MKDSKTRITDRVLAFLLSFVMIVGLMPMSLVANAAGIEDCFTITVKCSGSPVSGATVSYTISDTVQELSSGSETTDSDGVVALDLSAYTSTVQTEGITLAYNVSANGYDSANDSVNIDNVSEMNGNVDVAITEKAPDTAEVTVSVSGDATVKLNDVEQNSIVVDEGTQVKVEIIPNENCYIKELSVGGASQTVEKGSSFTDTITVDDDINISASVVEEVTVTNSCGENGTITLNGNNVSSLKVDKASEVAVSVQPDQGYYIASVTIGTEGQTVTDPTSFSTNITANANITVAATFVKVYKIEVSSTGEGVVVTTPSTAGGFVVVNTGTDVTVTATPNTNYRVSEVLINGTADNTVLGDNDEDYSYNFSADKDYNFVITFAPNKYVVSINNPTNGKAQLSSSLVEYGSTTTITCTPNTGYEVADIIVNGVSKSEYASEGQLEITITQATSVEVSFAKVDVTDSSGKLETDYYKITFSNGSMENVSPLWTYTDGDGNTVVVFPAGTKAKLTPKSPYDKGIKYNDSNAQNGYSSTVTISETKLIKNIYTKKGNLSSQKHNDIVNLRFVIDTTKPTASITPSAANTYGYYNSDVTVDIKAEDPNYYSGIASVDYAVVKDGDTANPTQSGNLYTYDAVADVDMKNIRTTYSDRITVLASDNNSDNVVVYVTVTDRAGCKETYTKTLKINTTKPTVSVAMDTDSLHSEATTGYYNHTRTAYVTFIDRASCFDQDAAQKCIKITAVDGKSNSVANAAKITWTNTGDTHQAKIEFSADANYTWYVNTYKNKADLENEGLTSETGTSVYEFAVDTKAPTGTIKVETSTWNSLLSTLTFGIWKNYSVSATATITDATSKVYDIQYYKSNTDTKLSESDLNSLFANGKFGTEVISVDSDQKFVVYARLTDYAGNHSYISTNGIIYDNTKSTVTLTPDTANKNGYYNKDVKVAIEVDDNVGEVLAYSGIKTVDYKVLKDGTTTQSGNLYTFKNSNPQYSELTDSWKGSITVDSSKNNSDDVEVIVTVVDNAGNTYEAKSSLSINVDRPTAKLTFDNNGIQNNVDGRGYYNAERKATLTITDRATTFDSTLVNYTVNAVDAKGNKVASAYTVGDWSHNGNEHSVDITFDKDANIEWSFDYTNKADKELDFSKVNVGTNKTPYKFTVDTNNPTGEVTVKPNTWDNLLSVLTFGLYSKVKVDVSASAADETSPYKIEYYKHNGALALTSAELDTKTFAEFQEFSVSSDEQFTVYLKVTDKANNYSYISSDGNIVDMKASSIVLTPDEANKNGCYNKDVDVNIAITDSAPYSGIKTIDYTVVKDGDTENPTQTGNLYTFNVSNPTQADLKATWTGKITVDAEKNNSSDVVVTVKTVDNAGNESTETVALDIDITKPTIEITFNNNKDNNGNTYFDADRTATVVITERTNHFDANTATKGISITAKDVKSKDIENAYTISNWSTNEGSTPDAATHTATIHFAKDANYTFAIAYTDKADNENSGVDAKNSVAPFKFTVDTVKPVGTVTAKSAEGREVTWDELVNDLTFGFWSKQKITLSGTSDDVTSPIASVDYYKVTAKNANDGTTALTSAQLDDVTEWTNFKGFDVLANEQFTVYIRITDEAGNYTYISTDGLIVDDQAPIEETIAPEITVKPEQPINGIYNKDVKVDITVKDPLVGGTYSGLKTVSYKVFNMGVETQNGTLYSFNIQNPKQSELLQTWTGNITVDSTLNNSNDVVIEVYAEDNSLNSSKDKVSIKIDITAPTIDISYNNNNVDSGKYFKDNRTATIVVTERNFKADDVKITITNTEKVIPSITEWKKVEGTENLDNTTWTTTVTYDVDGDYTFDIAYTDLAGNACAGANYGDSVQPTEFTIDKTIPVINVTYDNNNALNTNYYKEARTATIVITEHNFNTDRIKVVLTATDDGTAITAPVVSNWANNGDTHTATIAYTADALYNFDIDYTDLAGNAAADFAQQTFYVDKTAPKLEISGVKNESANNGDVIPVITYSDTNFNIDNVTITLNGAKRKAVALDGSKSDIHNGQVFTFKNFAKEQGVDDIYTLTAKLTDKAGNSTEQTITFSVNRFGSTYALSKESEELNGTYVQKPIDVVITETNANELSNVKITLFKNDKTIELEEGKDFDYTVDVNGGNGQWYHYTYTVFAKNFADDGVYRLTIHSEDAAGNVAENTLDTKNTSIQFGIDSTKPTITVTNLDSGTTYALDSMTVKMSIKDNLLLSSVSVYLDDYNKALKTWSAEEVAKILESNGEFTFEIPGDSTKAHKVKIVTVDAAGNENSEEITDFYVTTNLWVRYYTNKPLFFGSIGGVILIAGLAVFLVTWKKKKAK